MRTAIAMMAVAAIVSSIAAPESAAAPWPERPIRLVAWDGPSDLPAGPGPRMALFPQEWYRDPDSHWLRTLASDAPWHDPALLAAMLALPFGSSGSASEPRAVAAAS